MLDCAMPSARRTMVHVRNYVRRDVDIVPDLTNKLPELVSQTSFVHSSKIITTTVCMARQNIAFLPAEET